MKKFTAVLSVVLILAMLCAPMAFASGLEVVSVSPKDGQKGLQTTNIAVKVKFNEEVSNTANDAVNQTKFVLKAAEPDADGNVVEFSYAKGNVQLVHSDKYPDELWYILNGTIASDAEYDIEIQSGIVANSGEKLGSNLQQSFRTRNTKNDSYISIAMMVGMMVIMVVATSKAAKKQKQQNDPKVIEKQREEALNPYKIAKEKNISLDEAKAYVAKEKAKIEKEQAKLEAERRRKEAEKQAEIEEMERKIEEQLKAQRAEYIYHVKERKSITLTGREVPKAVVKLKKKRVEQAIAKEKAAEALRAANAKGKKSKK